jgi:ferredoxin-like protein FixX
MRVLGAVAGWRGGGMEAYLECGAAEVTDDRKEMWELANAAFGITYYEA